MNANEHYVSQVLLRRFTVSGHLQCFKIQESKWRRKSPKKVFSEFGYNQLLVDGKVDDTLEKAFCKVETNLPQTLKALDNAAIHSSTELPPAVYENLCWYCAFIKRISPFSKVAAPADFVLQANHDLEKGHGRILREVLNVPEELIHSAPVPPLAQSVSCRYCDSDSRGADMEPISGASWRRG